MCFELGQRCANAAMVFAMLQIQVGCLVRHGIGAEPFRAYMRELVEKQLLLASATTEAGVGGDVRTSLCFVERTGDRFKLEKNAPVISYGDHADAILVTSRRAADAPNNDQVIALCRKDNGETKLVQQHPLVVCSGCGTREPRPCHTPGHCEGDARLSAFERFGAYYCDPCFGAIATCADCGRPLGTKGRGSKDKTRVRCEACKAA